MKTPQYVQSKLANALNPEEINPKVHNNRMTYRMRFVRPVDWQEVYSDVKSVANRLGVEMFLTEIVPATDGFVITVSEKERRSGIDEDQDSLFQYERVK